LEQKPAQVSIPIKDAVIKHTIVRKNVMPSPANIFIAISNPLSPISMRFQAQG